ncbi:MAG: tetratricopeptide repeat protein, partial [Azoarcus sp.]|nr:tetratricopeptide repeat protein [Azoarcus sp.]
MHEIVPATTFPRLPGCRSRGVAQPGDPLPRLSTRHGSATMARNWPPNTPFRKEIMMSNTALHQRFLAQRKLFFRNKGAVYKAVVAISLLLAAPVGMAENAGAGNGEGSANAAITRTSNGPQLILPNLEYLADKNIRMAENYYEQRKYPEALKHYEEAYKKQEKALEAVHAGGERGDVQKKALADILVSKGVMHIEMVEYEDANKDFTEAEGIYGQLSAGEGDYAVIYHHRGRVFNAQGDYGKALEWHRKALAIWEKTLGKGHPLRATAYNNIAEVYRAQGKYEEALEWHRKALAIREKVLGKEHPDTATTYNNIAGVYRAQSQYEEALEW